MATSLIPSSAAPSQNILQSMQQVFAEAGTEINAEQMGAIAQHFNLSGVDPEVIEAGSEPFKQRFERVSWHERLTSALKIFCAEFRDLHDLTDEELKDRWELEPQAREPRSKELIKEFSAVMKSLSSSHPGATDDWQARSDGMEAPYLYLSAKTDGAEGAEETHEINHVLVNFSAAKTTNNRQRISGTLFLVDEPSEAIPAVGTGLPLYIPREVAAQCLSNVAGLPFVSGDGLKSHKNEVPYGTILRASIQNNEFIVTGHLWDETCPEWVQKIAAEADGDRRLGMSMNASAFGHAAEVDGRQVFWIDQLDIKGGNILYADSATYQQTSVTLVAASKFDPDSQEMIPVLIAAENSTQEDEVMDTILQQELAEIKASLGGLKDLATAVGSLGDRMAAQEQNMQLLMAERQSQQQQVQAQADAEKAKTDQQNLATLISTAVSDAVAKAVNPSGIPVRQSTPLMAGAGDVYSAAEAVDPAMQYRLELAGIDARLEHPQLVNAADIQRRKELIYAIQQVTGNPLAAVA